MADLTFKVDRLSDYPNAALVSISGAIDAKTVITFQEKLDLLQKEGILKYVLDMGGIKYVNSTGLGTLVNVADTLENSGGGIALVKIHPKVRVVFDMLGLNAFFKIFTNVNEAMSFFSNSGPPTTNIQTPPPETSSAQIVTEPSPEESTIHVIATKPIPTGGFALECFQCSVTLTLKKAGSYKCPRCSTFFKIGTDGKASFFARKKADPIQMKLVCTEECYTGLSYFIAVLAKRIGFASEIIRNIQTAVSEVCMQVIEHAYQNAQHESYNVLISPSSTQLEVKIADYGKVIPQNDARFFAQSKKIMDKFEHKLHPKGGNVITMIKNL